MNYGVYDWALIFTNYYSDIMKSSDRMLTRKRSEAVLDDGALVNENIRGIFVSDDEAVALLDVEELHLARSLGGEGTVYIYIHINRGTVN
jgi:hypothetical protein